LRGDEFLGGWAAVVNRIVRGESPGRPRVILGPTPDLLQAHGLNSGGLTMAVAKIALCRRIHPEVPLQVWYDLPELLAEPVAVFPSAKRDGSMVVLLLVCDRDGSPVLVAIVPDHGGLNAVLSVYGKENGFVWAANEMDRARGEGLDVYEGKGFAASLPQPPTAEAVSSSPGPIPADGTAKPRRQILSLRKKSTES